MIVGAWADRAQACGRWLFEPRLVWVALVIVVAAVGLCVRPGATELHVRMIAAALQLLGVGQVAWGIRETRKLFGRPGVVEWTRAWWDRRPTRARRVHVGAGHVALGSLKANVRGTVDRKPDPSAPLEQRIATLERRTDLLDERITEAVAEIDRVEREHGDGLRSETQSREEADDATRKFVESTQTGGLALSTAGAVILAVGIVLGSFPERIAGCFG